MTSKVYFTDLKARAFLDHKIGKIGKLFDQANLKNAFQKDDRVAIKVHFGERGNDAFVSPLFIRAVIDKIQALGALAFLTDTNTLYKGSRSNAIDHINLALEHGFGTQVTKAPIIIADGIDGTNDTDIDINAKHFKTAKIATEFVKASSMMVVSHFKGHGMSGFGGAIKNLAMGCASARGKKEQHAVRPQVEEALCIGCKVCEKICPKSAIVIKDKKAKLTQEACIGCGDCITHCPQEAVSIAWEDKDGLTGYAFFTERLTEYAFAATSAFEKGKIAYMNFVTNVTPNCDCFAHSDVPLVADIGILASSDPLALDKACYDLVTQAKAQKASILESDELEGVDKFMRAHPKTRPLVQFDYGEKLGLGTSKYELIKI